jgi:SAM-dependent methyltransferase
MPELVDYESCIVCGSKEYSVLATKEQLQEESQYRDRLFRSELMPGTPEHMLNDLTVFTNDYAARLVKCKPCGLVSRDPRFSPAASIQAYAKDDYHPDWLESSFQEYYASFRSQMPRLIKQIGPEAHILEVGSYVGGFLAAAREFGWQAQGVDVGKRVSDFVRSKGFQVTTGTLLEARLPDATFDAAFVWVCFDQLPDPWAVLREFRRVLRPGGWLILAVPNGDFVKWIEPLARHIRWRPFRECVLKILTYTGIAGFHFQTGYTPASLKRILRANGFDGISIRNRINLADAQECKQYAIPEQGVFLSRVLWASEALAQLSLGEAIKGPWIQIDCRKSESAPSS